MRLFCGLMTKPLVNEKECNSSDVHCEASVLMLSIMYHSHTWFSFFFDGVFHSVVKNGFLVLLIVGRAQEAKRRHERIFSRFGLCHLIRDVLLYSCYSLYHISFDNTYRLGTCQVPNIFVTCSTDIGSG